MSAQRQLELLSEVRQMKIAREASNGCSIQPVALLAAKGGYNWR